MKEPKWTGPEFPVWMYVDKLPDAPDPNNIYIVWDDTKTNYGIWVWYDKWVELGVLGTTIDDKTDQKGDIDYTNCPNCCAPVDRNKDRCPYCETPYIKARSRV